MSKKIRVSAGRVVVLMLAVPLLLQCSMIKSAVGTANDAAHAAKGCPDLSSMDAIAKIEFDKEFSMDPKVGAKVKAGVMAGSDLTALAASIDADLKTSCSGLAKGLGGSGDYKSGTEACQGAVKQIGELKAKIGPNATIAVAVKAPVCSASLDAVADCAGKCDASVKGGKADIKCEGGEVSGICDADCTGKCELSAAATCSGTCTGSCDADFSGTCRGRCAGTCDGKEVDGACTGKCEGSCAADANGSCAGKCSGSCESNASGKCEGTCTGKCSVALKEPTCSGQVVPPKMSAECKSTCDVHGSTHLVCTKPEVVVNITGSADADAAAQYKSAVEANLPQILKVALGMRSKLEGVVVNGKTTIEGGIAAGQAVVKGRPTAAPHVTACLLNKFTGSMGALLMIQSDIKLSVDVKDCASASGSASARAASSSASG